MKIEVYVPVRVEVDTETGDMTSAPYIDADGMPWPDLGFGTVWMQVTERWSGQGQERYEYDPDCPDDEQEYDWFRDQVLEGIGYDALIPVLRDYDAINTIHALLDGQEWDPDTLDAIATVIAATGREVRDPMDMR